MAIVVKPYTEDLVSAVKQFNVRLFQGGVPSEFQFPETHVPVWLPKKDKSNTYQEYFLAMEGGSVRGGYIVKRQNCSFRGTMQPVAYYHLPLSEGIVQKTYVAVGAQMLRDALKRDPLMFALGMGGIQKPLPRMLKAMGWKMCAVPLFFKVLRPARFLRQLSALRVTPWRRYAMDLAAFTGAGFIGLKAVQRLRATGLPNARSTRVDNEARFGPWADELWSQCKGRYAMVAARDSATLAALYPENRSPALRLKVIVEGECVGWAVILDTPMRDDKYFGNLRVGSIVDCLASPENAAIIVRAAAATLDERGVDLIVSNQLHRAWCDALKGAGFLEGPSNFIFAASQPLSEWLAPFDSSQGQIHMNRGDGDGPIHL